MAKLVDRKTLEEQLKHLCETEYSQHDVLVEINDSHYDTDSIIIKMRVGGQLSVEESVEMNDLYPVDEIWSQFNTVIAYLIKYIVIKRELKSIRVDKLEKANRMLQKWRKQPEWLKKVKRFTRYCSKLDYQYIDYVLEKNMDISAEIVEKLKQK